MRQIKAFIDGFATSFHDLIYPSVCRSCKEPISGKKYLCTQCLDLLELVNAKERCPFCFSSIFNFSEKLCSFCRKKEPIFDGLAASFDYEGPAASLVRQLKYGNEPYLAEGMGAFLALQFSYLNWPIPDLVIPMPASLAHRFERGYNQSELLAESFVKIINTPILKALKRKSGDYSQAGLSYVQRKDLTSSSFYLVKDELLHDKIILLIDDVMTTGATLNNAAEVIREGFPKKLYGLTFCCATK